jgi:prolyl 4-hydroxylase
MLLLSLFQQRQQRGSPTASSFLVAAALTTIGTQTQHQRHRLYLSTKSTRSNDFIDKKAMMTPQHQQQQQQLYASQPHPQHQHPPYPQLQQQPVFNGVNLQYPGLKQIYYDPPMYCVDDFLSPEECQFLIGAAEDSFTPAPVVGKGAGEVSHTRTSSTCYLDREDLPNLLRKVSQLTLKPMEHMELPQVGRYLPLQQYYQHYDAFNLDEDDGRRFAANGGQRTVTVLIYLNDVARGGQTSFPTLNVTVQPRRGMALIFFPATVDGTLDPRVLHAALPAVDTKFVSQIWIRQGN